VCFSERERSTSRAPACETHGIPLPEAVRGLFWDIDPDALDLVVHRDDVLERVMVRGTLEAMRWLRATDTTHEMAEFLLRRGDRLPPRDRASWALIAGLRLPPASGRGRPPWA